MAKVHCVFHRRRAYHQGLWLRQWTLRLRPQALDRLPLGYDSVGRYHPGRTAGQVGGGLTRTRHSESHPGCRAVCRAHQLPADAGAQGHRPDGFYIHKDYGDEKAETCLIAAEGEEIRYSLQQGQGVGVNV